MPDEHGIPPPRPPSLEPRAARARLLILALGIAILVASAHYLAGLLGAAVLYVVCAPAYHRLAPRLGARAAAVGLAVASVAMLLVPFVWLGGLAVAQAPDALRRVLGSEAFARLTTLRVAGVDVGAQLAGAGGSMIAWLSGQALHAMGGLTRATLNLLLALVGLYYLLRGGADELWARARHAIPFSPAGTDELRARFSRITEATLLGIAATAIAQGVVVGTAFWLVGLPDPVVWGAVTAIASVLPVLGSSLVWLPGVVVLVAERRLPAAGLLLAIGVIVASNIDNLLRPIVYKRVSNLHPMTTLLGAFVGVELIGLVGLLLGPLAIAYFFELLHLYEEEYGSDAPAPRSAHDAGPLLSATAGGGAPTTGSPIPE